MNTEQIFSNHEPLAEQQERSLVCSPGVPDLNSEPVDLRGAQFLLVNPKL
jgi:hypothetical protein